MLTRLDDDVDVLSGKLHAIPTRVAKTGADEAEIIRDVCLRSGDGFPKGRVGHQRVTVAPWRCPLSNLESTVFLHARYGLTRGGERLRSLSRVALVTRMRAELRRNQAPAAVTVQDPSPRPAVGRGSGTRAGPACLRRGHPVPPPPLPPRAGSALTRADRR
jgi:hypothetical protein